MSDFSVEILSGQKIVIEMRSGLLSSVHAPEGLEIIVVDHDVLADDELCSDDDVSETMASSPSLPWGEGDYGYRPVMRELKLSRLAATEIKPGTRQRASELAERREA